MYLTGSKKLRHGPWDKLSGPGVDWSWPMRRSKANPGDVETVQCFLDVIHATCEDRTHVWRTLHKEGLIPAVKLCEELMKRNGRKNGEVHGQVHGLWSQRSS